MGSVKLPCVAKGVAELRGEPKSQHLCGLVVAVMKEPLKLLLLIEVKMAVAMYLVLGPKYLP